MSTPDSVHPILPFPLIARAAPRAPGALASLEALPPVLVAAAGLVILQTVAFVSTRLLAVSYASTLFTDTSSTEIMLGAVSFMSIVVVAGALVLGHRALRASAGGSAIVSQVAAIVLGAAYLHLILWTTRIVAAAFAAKNAGASAAFLSNVFWWG
jgi:hypothetical protein